MTHAINPYIYGMNAYTLNTAAAKAAALSIDRWGGDATSRYNYLLDVTSSASDWYFENQYGLAGGTQSNSSFNAQVTADASVGARTIGTVPVNGWIAKDGTSCSFPVATYPNQAQVDSGRGCGTGFYAFGVNGCTNSSGCNITGNKATDTSTAIDATWTGNWVKFLVGKFGNAASGGVAVYDLDNEPSWWMRCTATSIPRPLPMTKSPTTALPTRQQSRPPIPPPSQWPRNRLLVGLFLFQKRHREWLEIRPLLRTVEQSH